MSIRFVALDTEIVDGYRAGKPDGNGQTPERQVAAAAGYPCRHCLEPIGEGEPLLVLAHCPFAALQPYAETGPIFLHARACQRGGGSDRIPSCLSSPSYIVRGYGADDRIVYGTGGAVPTSDIPSRAISLLADTRVAYVHVRSAANNCYQCRIDRVR